ncbi:MAG: hypothetical protein OIF47_04965 [Marinibacterium sp.]|nr:hypothetical protein [Marinibacterium sp.]
MIRLLILFLLLPTLLYAQDDGLRRDGARAVQAQTQTPDDAVPQEPLIRIQFDETEAIPGQPLSLRMTVLVPTNLVAPPVWPSLEAPNLLVRLPERSTGPVSEQIGGDTWSGVSRHFRISPMVPGDFTIPPQEVAIRWQSPDGPQDTRLQTDAIAFSGVIPDGADGLDPFIAAQSLELSRDLQGDPQTMQPGDSLTLTLTARVGGVSPMFLPPLSPQIAVPGIAAYPDEPVVSEQDDRGVPGGTRVETTSLVAEGGGTGEVPAVTLDWYNITSGVVETATLTALPITVDGPPARRANPRDWRVLALGGLACAAALALLGWAGWRIRPVLRTARQARRARYMASERQAWDALQQVIRARDHTRLYAALDRWAGRCPNDPRPEAQMALLALGAARYGSQASGTDTDMDTDTGTDTGTVWRQLSTALHDARRIQTSKEATSPMLPPLNPARTSGT